MPRTNRGLRRFVTAGLAAVLAADAVACSTVETGQAQPADDRGPGQTLFGPP